LNKINFGKIYLLQIRLASGFSAKKIINTWKILILVINEKIINVTRNFNSLSKDYCKKENFCELQKQCLLNGAENKISMRTA